MNGGRRGMIHEHVSLEKEFPGLPAMTPEAVADTYIPEVYQEIDENRKFPCVIICPGGGYMMTSRREAEPVAMKFLAEGIAGIVLNYSVAPEARYPVALLQAAAAVALARRNAEKWHLDPDRICIMGFSAGGHLAASLGVFWNDASLSGRLGLTPEDIRPDGLILCYAVLTAEKFTHVVTIMNLLGDGYNGENVRKMSLERHVTAQTPKTFIFHTVSDRVVAVENALKFITALQDAGVSYEAHLYPEGVHGMSVCDETAASKDMTELISDYDKTWVDHCIAWIKNKV